MSRVGKKEIVIPKGVEVKLEKGQIFVKGPKGTLSRRLHPRIKVESKEDKILVSRPSEDKETRALHGLTRALIYNMVKGVMDGFEKNLELSGVGYKASKKGNNLVLQLGYSHPVEIMPPQGVEISVSGPNKIKVSGIDKEAVGSIAAEIRKAREVEPYKAKGVKYAGEQVRRKAGKIAKAVGAAGA